MLESRYRAVHRSRPSNSVCYDLLDFRLMENRERLMAGPEIEHFPSPAVIAATAAEHFATWIPADEDERVRRGDVKALSIHLDLRDFYVLANTARDRVARLNNPKALVFTELTPFQSAGGAHQLSEDFREVGRMERDQSHAIEHSSMYLVDY